MGFPGYFLIVADFIQWAKDNGIPVGPGRGSGAGSLVAYALKITDLDPIEHDLLFERFLNPERVSMPDFDVDFCMEGRDRVIDYVAGKYGREAVSQIITFGTMAAKAVVRDVGRVMGHPYGFVDKIAKMVPFELGMTLEKALKESEDLKKAYEDDEEVRAAHRHGAQAGGPDPQRRQARRRRGHRAHAADRLRAALLRAGRRESGHPVRQGRRRAGRPGQVRLPRVCAPSPSSTGRSRPSTPAARSRASRRSTSTASKRMTQDAFALLKRCETTAVFQLESRGMKELIKKLQPDSFGDITALVALFRPGPLQSGMVDDFIDRKHGRADVAYPHPDLEPVLKPTYGIILYQEQVMQIAQVLAGYSLGGADLLRRAMGKKKQSEMDKQRAIFEEGSVGRGVERETATYIFDLMDKFAGYGFNKSHSAAYALVSYQTLWLKAHYPAAFMAAVLSADMDNTDKVVTLIDECRAMKLRVEPPAINGSSYQFTVADEGTVVYGMGAIKGVGESAIESMLEARRQGGPFRDLWDFCCRIDLHKVNRRVLEALIRAGALDGLGPNRATLMAHLPLALKAAEQHNATQAAGQCDLFGALEPTAAPAPDPQLISEVRADWEDEQRLQGEKETLGLYLTGHPIDRYEDELKAMGGPRIAKLLETDRELGRRDRRDREKRTVAGLVVSVRHGKTQRGRMGSLLLDDRTGRIEVTVFSELYDQVRGLLVPDQLLSVTGALNFDEFRDGWSLRADAVRTFEQARESAADHLALTLDLSDPTAHDQGAAWVETLREALATFRDGDLAVRLTYRRPGAVGELVLGNAWRVQPTDALLKRLRQVLGADAVRVAYERPALPAPMPEVQQKPRLMAVS